MNKAKRNGFTLVELLAVIVILAVVILIAVTAVVPRMNNAKKKAFLDEALVYYKAAKEAYVTDPLTECYNVSDMSNLVKQTKDGYSGTVYVNEKGVSLNLTNGKYYMKTDTQPSEYYLKTTKPDKFIDTCSDNETLYTITYDLPSDATVSGNPSNYTANDQTITLNNPTRPGYKFLGWSSKNLLDMSRTHTTRCIYNDDGTLISDISDSSFAYIYNTYLNDIFLQNPGTNYTFSMDEGIPGKKVGFIVNGDRTNSTTYKSALSSEGSRSITLAIDDKFTNVTSLNIRFNRGESHFEDKTTTRAKFQIEKGSTATDYQEYMDPTTTAKIYRGSTGNKTFISNWEPL